MKPLPEEVLNELRCVTFEFIEEQAAVDEMSGKVWTSLEAYMEEVGS